MEKKTLSPKRKLMVLAICAAVLLLFIYISLFFTEGASDEASSTALEQRLEDALAQMRGVGDVRVVIHYTEAVSASAKEERGIFESEKTEHTQEVSGVLVVAEGAEDIRIRMDLLNAVSALMDISADCVEVLY